MLKTFPLNGKNVTKHARFFLSRAPTRHSFTFNLRFHYKLRFASVKICVGFFIFNFVSFILKFIFLFNKKHGLFDFKTSKFLFK